MENVIMERTALTDPVEIVEELLTDPTPTTRLITVTPAVAEELVGHGGPNRPLDLRHVHMLAADMRAGRWITNNAAIGIDSEGEVNDGNHRLHAVIESGVPIDSVVVSGLAPGGIAQATMDIGKKRNFGQALAMPPHNEVNAAPLAAAVSLLAREHHGIKYELRATWQQKLQWLNDNPTIRDSVRIAKNIYNGSGIRIKTGPVAALHFKFHQINPTDAEAFWEQFKSGANLPEDHPIHCLRKTLLKEKLASNRQIDARREMALIIKAWNAYRDGTTMLRLWWRSGGAKPEPFPEPY